MAGGKVAGQRHARGTHRRLGAASLGFERVYLVSDHRGLYEKYGFAAVDAYPAPWDEEETETVFARETHP